MHARIEQLLSLRDGEPVATDIRDHVQQCAHCSAEIARLVQVREGLRALPQFEPPLVQIADLAQRTVSRPSRRIPFAFAASFAAFIACGIAFVALRDSAIDPVMTTAEFRETAADEQLRALMMQSRELEEILDDLPQRPSVQRASLATTVDSIEERIQWLDWQLANNADEHLDRRQAQRLWSERVELMDSLVKVRYAESAPMVF